MSLPKNLIDDYAYLSTAYGKKLNQCGEVANTLEQLRSNPLCLSGNLIDEMQVRLYLQDPSLYTHLKVRCYTINENLLQNFIARTDACLKLFAKG